MLDEIESVVKTVVESMIESLARRFESAPMNRLESVTCAPANAEQKTINKNR